ITVVTDTAQTIGTGAGQFNLIANSGLSGGNGGTVSFSTTGGASTTIANTSALAVGPLSGTGNGGNISISADEIDWPNSGMLSVLQDVSVACNGNGGQVALTVTTTTAQTLGSAAGNFQLIANSGLAGGNAGNITFQTGGNLTVNPAGVSAAIRGSSGNG